jgi:hypothetical protein
VPPPQNTSPVATPINTPEPGTPPGRYEIDDEQDDPNCAHVGLIGQVVQKNNDQPVSFVTIEVTGDDDNYKGPYYGKTGADGKYTIVIGEFTDDVKGTKFKAKVVGEGVDSEDTGEWIISDDCHNDDAVQIYEINWFRKD